MADQRGQFVLQVESAQQVGLLIGKELDQKIDIAVLAPFAENRPENPLAISEASSFAPEFLPGQPWRESVPTGSVTEQVEPSRDRPRPT